MLTFIVDNLATILISAGLFAMFALAARSIFGKKAKKAAAASSSCAGGCAGCKYAGQCH